ncbi:MAG TPA: phosphoadenosine phosphosulfate reductase family protein, partial [Cytophagaceae bacterium]
MIAEQQKLFSFLPDEIENNEFILFDRIEKIKSIINQFGEENFYLSFSGGKDSTVLHYLLDMAIPGNKIPRVFCNTGLEYRLIYKFVKSLQTKDKRIIMISPRKNIVKTLERVGYPFK